MIISKHSHPLYFVLFNYLFAVSAFLVPVYFLYSIFAKYPVAEAFSSPNILPVLITIPFYPIVILITANFYQNITVTTEGLLVEFLWKELTVSWDEFIEIKPSYIFWLAPRRAKTYVVLTNTLTPFHRFYGLLYGLSVKPAFIIYPTISEYQSLVETIESHTKKN